MADPSIHVNPAKGFNSLRNSLGLNDVGQSHDITTFNLAFHFEDETDGVIHSGGAYDYAPFVAHPDECALCAVVIVAHAIAGITDNEKMYAIELAKRGYVAFATDVFGNDPNAGFSLYVSASPTLLSQVASF